MADRIVWLAAVLEDGTQRESFRPEGITPWPPAPAAEAPATSRGAAIEED